MNGLINTFICEWTVMFISTEKDEGGEERRVYFQLPFSDWRSTLLLRTMCSFFTWNKVL